MATTHVYDLAVKTGEYESNGQTKGRYENIGKVLRNDNGQFMLLKKTFNPAGVDSNGNMIAVSMFEPKANDRQQHSSQQGSGYGAGGQPSRELDDDLPF
ncbi:hypothetical protein [Pseudosulfitobacter pseudonitzschiae]|nr:hypothetical protein [Pseudosulfitobacter pseudonitzschiae]MBM1853609.1 hypothetical protein [Pseudosulfitobacter pseudonitzschiae]MBM1872971.1 hypothetical protein [Pseudosulfitobacter pseudonitzschiae]MBM1882676.1 hypothetical protein [Pseudosulfitobacter pseudonitzschiae]MBM1887433.1 hypothetical protein [Pseudosulfitobacter pseudonitzschiae]MBM1892392.1 hypothetical protein [Pseudosulfitobacter pseudonitzschiae]